MKKSSASVFIVKQCEFISPLSVKIHEIFFITPNNRSKVCFKRALSDVPYDVHFNHNEVNN